MNYNKLPRKNGQYIKLGNGKLEQTETLSNGMPNFNYTITQKLYADIVDMQDKVVCNAAISFAKEQGVSDLFLLDKEFVKTALLNEIKRQQKPRTNFDKITQNANALAEWIERMSYVDFVHFSEKQNLIKWLQKEAD